MMNTKVTEIKTIKLKKGLPSGKSFRFVSLADLHWDDEGFLSGSKKSKFWDKYAVLQETLDYSEENGIENIFFLGDLFHSRKKVPIVNSYYFTDFLEEAVLKKIKFHFLVGNHDTVADSDFEVINSLHSWKRQMFLFSHFADISYEGVRFYMLPFMKSSKETIAAIRGASLRDDEVNILMMHTEIQGAQVGSFYKAMDSEISPSNSCFDKFDLIMAGHYHKQQFLKDNMFYVGSPLQQDWGEKGERKGFWDIEIVDDRINLKLVEMDLPRHIEFDVDDSTFTSPVAKINLADVKNNYVKLNLTSSLAQIQIVKLVELLRSEARKVWVVDLAENEKKTRLGVDLQEADSEIISKYVDTFNFGDEMKERLKFIGNVLMGESE